MNDSSKPTSLPAEFAFNLREHCVLVLTLCGLCVFVGMLVYFNNREEWLWAAIFAVALPAFLVLCLLVLPRDSYHRSYVITQTGLTLRKHQRDLEHIPWSSFKEVYYRPAVLVTQSGRQIPLQLTTTEMQQARDLLVETYFAQTGRPAIDRSNPDPAKKRMLYALIIASLGEMTEHFLAWFGAVALPFVFILGTPDAPISLFFLYCMKHFGGIWFIFGYSTALLFFFCWSNFYSRACPRKKNLLEREDFA